MMATKSIMICGVGGQGTLLAVRVLGNMALRQGYDVKVSEVHGMSQRGGSVVTYLRFGDKVYSPIIEKGGADVILAFEKLEALRALPYVKKGGRIIVNAQEIDPMPVITGAAEYPQGVIENLKTRAEVTAIDAISIAAALGNTRTANVVLIGSYAKSSGIPKNEWIEVLKETVPARFIDVNIQAFEKGYEL